MDSESQEKSVSVSKERLEKFKSAVQSKFQAAHKQSLTVSEVRKSSFLQ